MRNRAAIQYPMVGSQLVFRRVATAHVVMTVGTLANYRAAFTRRRSGVRLSSAPLLEILRFANET